MVLAGGVSADGIRSAREASIWERIAAAVDMAKGIRLMFAYPVQSLSTAHCTYIRAFRRNSMKEIGIKLNPFGVQDIQIGDGEQQANMAQ
jgi:hypothetical protein